MMLLTTSCSSLTIVLLTTWLTVHHTAHDLLLQLTHHLLLGSSLVDEDRVHTADRQ